MGDLVFGTNIFPQTSRAGNFSPTYNGVRFFSSIIRHEIYFFSAGYFSLVIRL